MRLTGRKPSITRQESPAAVKDGELRGLGLHVRRRREELGYNLERASRELGVVPLTLQLWEARRRPPQIKFIPKIIAFLGYDPLGSAENLGGRLRVARLRLGLSRVELAQHLGVSIDAYERWEDGEITLVRVRIRRLLEAFLRDGGKIVDGTIEKTAFTLR